MTDVKDEPPSITKSKDIKGELSDIATDTKDIATFKDENSPGGAETKHASSAISPIKTEAAQDIAGPADETFIPGTKDEDLIAEFKTTYSVEAIDFESKDWKTFIEHKKAGTVAAPRSKKSSRAKKEKA